MLQTSMGDWRRTHYIGELGEEHYGSTVTVAGWYQDVRNLGGIAFLQLRDRTGVVQITLVKKELGADLFKAATEVPRESVIMVQGTVQENEQARSGFEVLPSEMKVISTAETPLPMGVIDKVETEMDTRLDSRFIDLRRKEVAARFYLRSLILAGVREQFLNDGFVEVHTPKIVATATEGGTALFEVSYFSRSAYLNQSPQLYKQILMASGLDRVFEIGPAFRAEEHDTSRHLNEFISIDIEMSFADDEDAMEELERVIYSSVLKIREHGQEHLDILGLDPEIPALPFPRIEYDQCVEWAREGGVKIEDGEDLSMEALRVVEKHEPGFYFITKWPTKLKPFYTQPYEDEPAYTRAFDLQFGAREITSGAQRVHDVDLLKKRLIEQGLDLDGFKYYIQAFRYGIPQHAGWGLGAERLTMILTNASNVRDCVIFPRDRNRLVP